MNARVVPLFCLPEIFQHERASVVWFRGTEYQPLLYEHITALASEYGVSLRSLPILDLSFDVFQLQCGTSFLGQSYVYWLGDCSALQQKKQNQWYTYMAAYRGPHTLLLYAKSDFVISIPSEWVVIDIKEFLSIQEIERILSAWYSKVSVAPLVRLVREVYADTDLAKVPTGCFLELYRYARVLGRGAHDFASVYGPHLVTHYRSLFTLSNYFFEGSVKLFYKEWANVKMTYQMPFWISFWSDHVWRAYFFIVYMRKNEKGAAQEIGKKRLPYTFMSTGWYTIDLEKLRRGHQLLYKLDFATKNGGNVELIEIFLLRWFSYSIQKEK
jgi:hypothetical protein